MPAEARLPTREPGEQDPRKYLQIATAVRAAIAAGGLTAGDRVLIAELAAEHHAARQTAAKALVLLEREGLVKRFPGHGYTVWLAGRPVAEAGLD